MPRCWRMCQRQPAPTTTACAALEDGMSDTSIYSDFNTCMFRDGCRKQNREVARLQAECAQLRADAADRQNNVIIPLREQVRQLEDALHKSAAVRAASKK